MTPNELNDITGQLAHIEGLICELQEALETLASDARDAADKVEEATPAQPDDDPDSPEEGDYDSEADLVEAMEKHDEIVSAADTIREKIERMNDLIALLRVLENVDYPSDLEVDEYELEDAFAALNE